MSGTYQLAQRDWDREAERLRALEDACDPQTAAVLGRLGVAPGWRCLEAGAGAGSVATWLADRVAPGGTVHAVDLDTTLLSQITRPNLTVGRLDIRTAGLPAGEFDLVHARCLVEHLPDPGAAVARLAAALRPGGWLVLETFDTLWDQLPAWPAHPASGQAAVTAVYRALLEHLHAVDSHGGRSMIEHLYACRLEGIGGQMHAELANRSGANRWLRLNVERFENELVAAGALTADQIASFYAFHDQPGAWMTPPLQVSVWGQRPRQQV